MTKLRSVGVGVVFLVGCTVGGAAGRFVVPPVSAEQAKTVTRWEYFCVDEYGANDIMPKANGAGAQGWEMVGGAGSPSSTWCFKRPKL